MWKAAVLTLFPDLFPGPLGVSVIGKALREKLWSLDVINMRNFSVNDRVDDSPYGGGPGMVIRSDILSSALDYIISKSRNIKLFF